MTDETAGFPARLHVLLASKARTAVVIRRGPSKAVCTIEWDRTRDTFTDGQWLRGRIYERRSDLSPDGNHLIYFAMNGHWESELGGSWTAISRAPWLRAVVLAANGSGCWNGGGLFTGPGRYWLNGGGCHTMVRDSTEVRPDPDGAPHRRFGGECLSVYYPRLMRDGWLLRDRGRHDEGHTIAVFEKSLRRGWVLRKLAHEQNGAPVGKGCYWDEHELEHTGRQLKIAAPEWEWADVDRNRLVYASRGCLYAVAPPGGRDQTLAEPTLLRDFNLMKFEHRAAPYK